MKPDISLATKSGHFNLLRTTVLSSWFSVSDTCRSRMLCSLPISDSGLLEEFGQWREAVLYFRTTKTCRHFFICFIRGA
jgi:hypothetical protein